MTSYDNLIIQRQTHNWQAFSIFFCLFFHLCRPYGGEPVFTDISYTGDGVRRFHPLPLQTFFVRHNRKVPECFLLCLLLCKSRLLRLYECYRQTGSAVGSGRPEVSASLPVHTMVSKFGKKFEDVSKLFDHAAHNGSNYLNGHCFVSLMLCVPVWKLDRISYLAVPLGYRMW